MEKPNVAPTMLWVVDTGNLRIVAIRSQIPPPENILILLK
jgi:hypothetical protein